jgi:SAM-dependent methyltransferase
MRRNRDATMKPGTPYRYIEHPFDTQFGVDTSGYIGARELAVKHAHDAFNNGYSAIAPSVFREAMRRWRKTLDSSRSCIESYSFVDVGAGKARPVLLAAELPFRKVIGVEINPALVTIAQWNAEKWRREGHARAPMRVVCADAAAFRWPRTPLLVYLYNPFERELVERLINRLRTAFDKGPHPLDVLYVNPVHSDLFGKGSGFRHLWSVRLTMDQADQDADPYATTTDVVSQYRLAPSPDAARR